jgi:hypothetical protein
MKWRPRTDEERLAVSKHDGMKVNPIQIHKTKVGKAPREVRSGNFDLPIAFSLQSARYRFKVIFDQRGVGAN